MDQEHLYCIIIIIVFIGCIIVIVVWRMGKLLISNCGTFDT